MARCDHGFRRDVVACTRCDLAEARALMAPQLAITSRPEVEPNRGARHYRCSLCRERGHARPKCPQLTKTT